MRPLGILGVVAFVACLAAALLLMVRQAPASGMPAPPAPAVNVLVFPSEDEPRIVLEAEAGRVVAPMKVFEDPSASGAKYVMTPEPEGANEAKGGYVELPLDIRAGGQYNLWLRVWWDDSCDNSLSVRLAGEKETTAENNSYRVWQWIPVGPGPYELKAGATTLQVGSREDGSRLDQVLLTRDLKYVPQDVESSR